MGRITVLILVLVLVAGMGAGAQHGSMPADEERPSDEPGQDTDGSGGQDAPEKPGLPAQASNVATSVVDTVFNFVGDTVSGLGNALQSLLGGGQAAESGEDTGN